MAEAVHMREFLRRAGVDRVDLDDVMQEVAIGAVLAVAEGRYRPDPRVEPRLALRRWLSGIALKQLSHLRTRAHRWREVPCSDPWCNEHEPAEHLGPQRDAREALATLAALPRWARDMLLLVAEGLTLRRIAAFRGMPIGTAAARIRRARARFAALLARRER
jgi:RNA polymerase sigma-70 factor (ECF subfamily)